MMGGMSSGGELNTNDEKKRGLGVTLMVLIKAQGLTLAEAWRRARPRDVSLTDQVARQRAYRVLVWTNRHYPQDLQTKLRVNHLGEDRIIQELQKMLKAKRYDGVLKDWVPDWRTRGLAVQHLIALNGHSPRAIEQRIAAEARDVTPARIDVGPPIPDQNEWRRRWDAAHQDSETRMQQHLEEIDVDTDS